MYHIKTESYHSETPLYTKLTSGPGTLFVPEARVAKDYFNTGLYERGYIDWAVQNFADSKKDHDKTTKKDTKNKKTIKNNKKETKIWQRVTKIPKKGYNTTKRPL